MDAFEPRLAASLVEMRPGEPVPVALRDRVRAIPDRDGSLSAAGWLRRSLLITASIAGLGGLLALAKLPGLVEQAGALLPTRVLGVDPTIEGPGLITSMVPTLPIVGFTAIGALVIIVISRIRRNPRRLTDLVMAAFSAAFALAVAGLLAHPGPGDAGWNGFGPVLGFRQVDAPGVTDSAGQHLETLFEAARPREPFAIVFVVGNQGALPIRLEGVREDPNAASRIAPRWTALGVGSDPNAIGQPLEEVASFVPTDIAPGGYVVLYLIGKASACAIGAEPYAPDQAFAVRGPDIDLAYSILGLTNTATYHMPLVIEEPILDGCTGQQPDEAGS